jgi:hypothetical protein
MGGAELRPYCLATILLAVWPTTASAQTNAVLQQLQSLQGTLSVQHAPQMGDGALNGCSLIYEFMQQDRIYLQGNFVRVSGSVSLMSANGAVALTLKVVASELDPSVPDLFVRHLPPSRAYLVNADLSTNFDSLVSSYPSDTEGGIFAVYNLEPGINAIFEAMETGTVTVAFALQEGSMDIQMPIEIAVADVNADGSRVRDDGTMLQFLNCAQTLLAATL